MEKATVRDEADSDLDARAINTARLIPLEVVEAKGHGHAGTAMALAPLMHVLFQDVLRHNPADPTWQGRDRFVLSAGHASLALYVQLYLTGYGLELAEIAQARAFGTRTPGHPEIEMTPGVEMSTGPLGQGVASAVGLAGALRHKRALLGESSVFDSQVWVVAGDGCLMEGVSAEASSLAGTLALDNLILIWDDNRITIDGDDMQAFREDTAARYESYGWQVLRIGDPNDPHEILEVLERARAAIRPVLVVYSSTIGYPAPTRAGTSAAHAGAFGPQDVAATKVKLGFAEDAQLADLVSKQVLDYTRLTITRGAALQAAWEDRLEELLESNQPVANEYRWLQNKDAHYQLSSQKLQGIYGSLSDRGAATRSVNGQIIAALNDLVPLWGGSADLSGSTSVAFPGQQFSAENPEGNQWFFGIREHAMAAILNGIALEGTWRPYGSTYLAFSDYLRPALRLASLMELPVIQVFTHDSVAVGEDGPTHQPVEQLTGLRSVPGVAVLRPADGAETVGVWQRLIGDPEGPVALALSRQHLPSLHSDASIGGSGRGGYVVWQEGNGDQLILIASGSEVNLALEAAQRLGQQGVAVRVVSIPCQEWFDQEPPAYQNEVLPPTVRARVAVEAGATSGWWKYVGLDGQIVGVDSFGASGPGDQILERLGISTENIVKVAVKVLEDSR